nr:hypothetical protein BaRGS_021124 [Batillaria attramentaria]
MTLRNGKAAGPDEIPAEAIKADTETAVNMLHSLFSKIWEKEEVPAQWKEGIIIKLPKKGDLRDCSNYRGIMLLSVPGKIASLRIIVEQSLEWNSPLYINFIDYEKAFDSVDREALWKLLRHYGVPGKIISLIRCTYQDMSCRIAHAGQSSESFEVKTGVRQGCLLSPFLFPLVIDRIMKTTTAGRKNGIQWTLWVQLDDLDFADDLPLLSHSHSQMQAKTTCLEATSAETGLKINRRKTELMKINTTANTPVTVGGEPIREVESFVYLGSVVDGQGGTDRDVTARIGKARAAMVMLKNVWASKVVSIRTKLRIFNSNVKSVLLYGCETWRTTKTMQQKIQTFLNTCLRRIFNIRGPENIRNEELWERAGQEPVAKQILRRNVKMATANRHVDLECPVCHEDFTEAKFLPCVHVAGQGDVISLVDKLPTDLATMALVESKRALADSHVCSVCENDIAATSLCPDCVKPIASIAKQKRETLTEQARRLRDRESEMTAHISKLDRELADAHTHFNSMRSKVKATFDDLQQMVEKRRQEINTKLQEEENSVVTPKQARKASLEEQRASVAAHAGSVERLVVPSPDSVLLGMLEKLRTRLDDLEKQTQLSPDSQDVRLASFTFNFDMVKRFEEAYAAFGVVTSKGEPTRPMQKLLRVLTMQGLQWNLQTGHHRDPGQCSQAGQGDVISLVDKLPTDLATMALVESKRALADSHVCSVFKATFNGLQQMVEKRRQEINTKLQEEENSVVTPIQAEKASLEKRKASVAAHAGSVERLVVPSPDSVLLGMLEKLRTRLNDLEKLTQLSNDRWLKPTGAELAKILKSGDRVKRGKDWRYGNHDGTPPGPGTVELVYAKGLVRVRWDVGSCHSYRMGYEGRYELELA